MDKTNSFVIFRRNNGTYLPESCTEVVGNYLSGTEFFYSLLIFACFKVTVTDTVVGGYVLFCYYGFPAFPGDKVVVIDKL